MQTTNLGYPRMGSQCELKKACEAYWSGKPSIDLLQQTAAETRIVNWKLQKDLGIDLTPSNDFSFYDQHLTVSTQRFMEASLTLTLPWLVISKWIDATTIQKNLKK